MATFEKDTLVVVNPSSGPQSALEITHSRAFTCVAISADDDMIAAGDVSGRISVWRGIKAAMRAALEESTRGQGEEMSSEIDRTKAMLPALAEPMTVHWHPSAVGALSFTSDGAHLLSGGREAVLVIWDLRSGARTFLPRLGGPIVGIRASQLDASRLSLQQSDNTLRCINIATMRVESSIHGVRPAPAPLPGRRPAPLAVQPGTGRLTVAGRHCQLQFYDLARDAHADRLAVSPAQNASMMFVAEEERAHARDDSFRRPRLTHLAFSRSGGVLLTAETRIDAGPTAALSCPVPVLKFWRRLAGGGYGGGYALSTLADDPHRGGDISAAVFHPSRDAAATASAGSREIRFWVAGDDGSDAKAHKEEDHGQHGATRQNSSRKNYTPFRCLAVAAYADQPITALSYTHDGSVLVAAAGSRLTLWNATSPSLLGVLPPVTLDSAEPGQAPAITHIVSVTGTSLVVAAMAKGAGLAVYCLMRQRVLWAAALPVEDLAADLRSQHWAVALRSTKTQPAGVLLFPGNARRPIKSWSIGKMDPAVRPEDQQLSLLPNQVLFVENGSDGQVDTTSIPHAHASPLLLVTGDRQYALLTKPAERMQQADKKMTPATPRGLEALYGNASRVASMAEPVPGVLPAAGTRPWAALLDAPSHALPSLEALCPAFLKMQLGVAQPAA